MHAFANTEVCAKIKTSGVFNFLQTELVCHLWKLMSSRSLRWLNKFCTRMSLQEEGRVVTHSKQVINFPFWNLEMHFIILLPMFCRAGLIFIQNIVLVFFCILIFPQTLPIILQLFLILHLFLKCIDFQCRWLKVYLHTFQDLNVI